MDQAQIQANYRQVSDTIATVAQRAGRVPDQIKLVVVTKGHPLETLRQAWAAGIRVFGENYVEEGLEKQLALEQGGIEWHMIGHLQSRKARLVSGHFDMLHSLDSVKLANRLDRFCAEFERRLPVLLECNVSGEASKFGMPAWEEESWSGLAPLVSSILALSHLQLCGLMTMAPFSSDPEAARPYFRRLRRLRDFLASCFPGAFLPHLSMGMSGDYQVAVQEGATIVRIGTAILGPRPAS